MKQFLKFLLPLLVLCSIVLGGITLELVMKIQAFGTLINYTGIVRGGTQRLIKLEIANDESLEKRNELIAYMDEIVSELNSGNGKYKLVKIPDEAYNEKLKSMTELWASIKTEIQSTRQNGEFDNLIKMSEDLFVISNDAVFAAEDYSRKKTWQLTAFIFIILLTMLASWIVVIIFYLRHLQNTEKITRTLSDIAYRDKLTGAPNLDKFRIDAQELMNDNRSKKYAVLYMDFDNFKCLNEILGHTYGDKLLVEYAAFLKESLSEYDTFCRYSADKFLVLRKYNDKKQLLKTQTEVDEKLSKFALSGKEQNFVTLRCGICCVEDMEEKFAVGDIIERANFARKSIKNNSIEHYAFYNDTIRKKMITEKTIENHMHAAMKAKEFVVFFQPKVNLKTSRVSGLEALARWKSKERGIISPAEFIPIFEKNMFIIKLDQYIFERVCVFVRSRIDEGLPVVPVSVNISRMQLYDADFVSVYTELKNRYAIPDGILEMEFTESVVFEDTTVLAKIIKQLKGAGFCCSLDDFGKGYSSLNLLKSLPVDTVKLDGLFFDDDGEKSRARSVIEGIVDMAKKLKLKVVAEGVEDFEQVEFLKGIGCDSVQGYVFYHPMSMEETVELLDKKRAV